MHRQECRETLLKRHSREPPDRLRFSSSGQARAQNATGSLVAAHRSNLTRRPACLHSGRAIAPLPEQRLAQAPVALLDSEVSRETAPAHRT